MIPIIDTHIHVYPDKIAEKAAEGTSRFYGVQGSYHGTMRELMAQGSAAHITHYVINSVATTPKQVHSINSYIAQTVAAHPGQMSGLGTLHPQSDDPERDVEEILALGLKGVKLHPDIQGFRLDDPDVLRLFELCQGRLPFLLHLGDKRYDFSNPNRVKVVLDNFPRLQLIGAHFAGWSIWEDATEALHRYERLLVDCSSSMYALPPETVTRLIRVWGAQRVLFGTDFPLMSPVREVESFLRLPLTSGERELIAYRNAAAFYRLPV